MTFPPEILHVIAVLAGVGIDRLYLRARHRAAAEREARAKALYENAIRAECNASARLRSLPAREQFDGDRR
jgi:hypothetical protein